MRSDFNKTIWVIVPVYNAEKWIRKCVRALQRQTYPNWKAVLVDDGSTDRSGLICDELAGKDERLVVLHTPNAGSNQARINGILQVPDDCYCIFCDSDDELTPNALLWLMEEAERSGADLICGSVQRMLNKIPIPAKKEPFFLNPQVYDHKGIVEKLYVACFGKYSGFPVALWSKMYHSSKLKEAMINPDPKPRFFAEDLNVTLHLLPNLDSISVISQTVYRYRLGGGTSRFMPTFLEDSLLMYHNKMKYVHLCEVDYDIKRLVAIELKNIVGTYLFMCEKFATFPHGSLEDEVRYVCGLEELADAMNRFTTDRSGFQGLSDAIRTKNYLLIAELIQNEVRKAGTKDFLKRILMH